MDRSPVVLMLPPSSTTRQALQQMQAHLLTMSSVLLAGVTMIPKDSTGLFATVGENTGASRATSALSSAPCTWRTSVHGPLLPTSLLQRGTTKFTAMKVVRTAKTKICHDTLKSTDTPAYNVVRQDRVFFNMI